MPCCKLTITRMLHISGILVWPLYTRATRQSYSPHPSLRLRPALWKDSCWIAGSQATSPSTRCLYSKCPMPWCAPLNPCLKILRRFQLGKALPSWTSFIPGSLKYAGLHVHLFYYQNSLSCTQLSVEVMCIEPASENQPLKLPLHTGRGTAASTWTSSLHTLGEPDSNTRSADSPERSESGAATRIHGATKCRYQACEPSPADGAGRAGAGCEPDVWSVFMPLSHKLKTSTGFDHDN